MNRATPRAQPINVLLNSDANDIRAPLAHYDAHSPHQQHHHHQQGRARSRSSLEAANAGAKGGADGGAAHDGQQHPAGSPGDAPSWASAGPRKATVQADRLLNKFKAIMGSSLE